MQIRLAYGMAKHRGDLIGAAFVAGEVAYAMAGEFQARKLLKDGLGDIQWRGHDMLITGTAKVGADQVHMFYHPYIAQQIIIKIARAEMQDIRFHQLIHSLFRQEQAAYRTTTVRRMSAK